MQVKSHEFQTTAYLFEAPWHFAFAITGALMLLATLFYPFGYDQAVFSVGGEMIIKHLAIPYRDFVDTKPPVIFYLYATALWLFGHHEWSIRIFDLLFQLLSSFYFYRILRRAIDGKFALATVSIVAMIYAGSGFWHTAQAESFAYLPSLLLLDMALLVQLKPSRAFWWGSIAGGAAIILFLLKFTLVLGAAATAVFLLFERDRKIGEALRFIAGMVASFLALAVVIGFALQRAGALAPFFEAMRWTVQYASITSVTTGASLVQQVLLLFPERFMYCTSPTVLLLGVWGIWNWIIGGRAGEAHPILKLLAVTLLFQLTGIVLERKIVFDYQYARALWAFVPFAILGGLELARQIKGRGPHKWIVGVLVLVAIAASPMVRMYTQSLAWAKVASTHQDAGLEVHKRIGDYFADEQRAVGEYLQLHMFDTERLFFWGNDVGVYWYARKLPPTICLTATPLRTAFTPREWRGRMMRQLIEANPKYVVVEFGDAKEYITGSKADSYQSLQQWSALATYVEAGYARDTVIGHYLMYRRR